MRRFTGNGLPLDLQMVNGLRNLGLALAALAAWPQARRLAGVIALFLALFASAMGDQPAIPYLLGLLALVGGLWLVADHRAGRLAATAAEVAGAEVRRVPLRFPLREATVFAALAAAACGVAVAGPKKVRLILGELVPTSGGTGASDPFSRGGVNDGPEETAGSDPTTAGMVDSDQMIETQTDSLIDVVSDMAYGKPHKPRKNQDRLIAAGLAKLKMSHDTPESKKPSRDFDTGRQAPQQGARKSPGEDARGLFEIEGRSPLHVRATVYHRYDAGFARWEGAEAPHNSRLEAEAPGGEWMAPRSAFARPAWYAADDEHALKVAEMRENLVPTPPMLTRLRVKKVVRPEDYESQADGVLGFAGRKKTPPGVVVRTECRTLDPARLPTEAFAGAVQAPHQLEVPDAVRPDISRIAAEWAGDRPRGWPQVSAVLAKLRADYAEDRRAVAPADRPAPILWFLNESRRGPDYLFATSAVLMLRSLGYPSRLCVGFYARPDAYDRESGHTPVRAADIHAWPEVLLSDGQWLPVEPTPGYDTLPALMPWREWAANRLLALADWCRRHGATLGATTAILVFALYRRRRLADVLYKLGWRLSPGRTWRERALRAARLLERRGRLAGTPRQRSETLAAWADRLGADAELRRLVSLAEWAAYAPEPPPDSVAAQAGRAALAAWPLSRFAPTSNGAAA